MSCLVLSDRNSFSNLTKEEFALCSDFITIYECNSGILPATTQELSYFHSEAGIPVSLNIRNANNLIWLHLLAWTCIIVWYFHFDLHIHANGGNCLGHTLNHLRWLIIWNLMSIFWMHSILFLSDIGVYLSYWDPATLWEQCPSLYQGRELKWSSKKFGEVFLLS